MPTTNLQFSHSRRIFTVSEVTKDIRHLLEDSFVDIWVSGEISNLRRAASGHLYFTLKDSEAQMGGVMFRGENWKLKFEPEDGLEVIAHGRISVYEPRGQYQIIVDHLEPQGIGALQLAFEQLKKRLEAEGLFDEAHKKPFPFLPKTIGIVTSPQGAVFHDMVNVLTRRYPNIEILLNPVLVQGEGAASQIAEAIYEFQETDHPELDPLGLSRRVDLLIVGRGGGSLEDLWAFNEEVVVRAIFNSKIPIISAVGHETDFTLADFVADLRAPTPSAAAELAVPEKESLELQVKDYASLLVSLVKQLISEKKETISFLKKQLKDPRRVVEDWQLKLDDKEEKLILAGKNIFKQKLFYFKSLSEKLLVLSPMAPLKRGYAIVTHHGKSLTSSGQVNIGDTLDVRLHRGLLKTNVVEKH